MALEIAYCRLVLERPKLLFAVTLSCHIIAILLTGLLNVSGYDILPIDFQQLPMQLESEDVKLQGDAWRFAASDPRVTWNFKNSKEKQSMRTVRHTVLEVFYENKRDGSNTFTKEALEKIQKFEKELYNNSVYQKELCLIDGNNRCTLPMSVIRFFDGTYRHLNPDFFDPEFQNVTRVLNTANLLLKSVLNYHLGKEVNIRADVFTSPITRSIFFTGYPFEGFRSTHDRPMKQLDKAQTLASDAFSTILDDAYENGFGTLKVHYLMATLLMSSLHKQVIWDLLLVCGSMAFIFVFMMLQTQSLWITGWSVFSIFSSFFGANIIYRVLLDFRYVGIFHVLSVFIILGIGADDVFVFYDTWRASKDKGFPNLLQRLSYTYKHAAWAMFITSFTTCVAFLTNVFSPLLVVSSFGVFSALIVVVNYVSIILFFPTVVITYEFYWKNWKWPCFDCKSNRVGMDQKEAESVQQEDDKRDRDFNQTLSIFFGETFYKKIIGHKVVRWILLAITISVVIVSIVFAIQLQPSDEQIEIMRPGSNWHDARRLRESAFNPSEEDKYVKVYVAWGLKNQDRSTCHFTDYKCPGQTVLDDGFDMSPPPCQIALLNFCQNFSRLNNSKLEELRIRLHLNSKKPIVHCFADAMNTYFKQEGKKIKYPNGSDLTLPINQDKARTLMKYNPNLYNLNKVTDEYYRFFEVVVANWITHGNTSYRNPDYKLYGETIGGRLDTTFGHTNAFQGGKYGNRLLYAAVVVETTLTPNKLSYVEGSMVVQAWNDYIREEMKSFPPSCSNAFQATPESFNAWHWIKVQEVLVINAIRGVCLSLALTLPILVIMTTNWIVALLCMLSIACTTIGVIGIIPILGWKLGVLESLNLTLVVGLAVDYVVHLAEGYVTGQFESRQDKVKHTLGHVGISVVSGACTTLGAAVFMFPAKILFFFQFGTFIFCTIGLSLVFSLFFFVTLLGIFGPQGTTGSIKPLYRYITNKIKGKKDGDVHCERCHGQGFYSPDSQTNQKGNKDGDVYCERCHGQEFSSSDSQADQERKKDGDIHCERCHDQGFTSPDSQTNLKGKKDGDVHCERWHGQGFSSPDSQANQERKKDGDVHCERCNGQGFSSPDSQANQERKKDGDVHCERCHGQDYHDLAESQANQSLNNVLQQSVNT